MKTGALLIILSCILVHSLVATGIFTTISTVDLKDWVLIGVSFLFLLFWLFIVNREWIKMIAFAYAERLHETLDEQI